jgi:hypothetical protein
MSHRGGNMIGLFPSLKLERMVAFESLIEQDYLYVLDYEQDVLGLPAHSTGRIIDAQVTASVERRAT